MHLIEQIENVIDQMMPQNRAGSVATISIQGFDPTGSPFGQRRMVTMQDLIGFLRKRFELENVNAAFRWTPGKGAGIFILRSAPSDNVVDGIYRQLKGSAQEQFTLQRPAMLCVQLRDFTGAQLRNVANATPNGLAVIATKLFSGERRSHLGGVSFMANEGTLTQRRFGFGDLARTSYQDVGSAYVFANPKHTAANAIVSAFGAPRRD